MGKKANDLFFDSAFNWLRDNTVKMTACTAEPAVFADIAATKLAEATMSVGDFTNSVGDINGRKVTVAAKSGAVITANGTATHIVLHNDISIVGYVTTCTPLVLTAGASNTVNFPSWKIEIGAPA